MIKIDMDFLESAWVECPQCLGKRFDHETLSIHYKEKNIYDVLEMDVAEALEFFASIPSIRHKLETLKRVGMEYIKLGQSSTTLSGGEAQRIKVAKELCVPQLAKQYTFSMSPQQDFISMISTICLKCFTPLLIVEIQFLSSNTIWMW